MKKSRIDTGLGALTSALDRTTHDIVRRRRAGRLVIAVAAAATAAAAGGWWTPPAFAASPVSGAREIHESREADRTAEIEISNTSGSVSVQGWDREMVEITGTLDENVERLEITGDRKHLKIRVILPDRVREGGEADLEVRVPAGAEVSVSTVSADQDIAGLTGELTIASVSGDISVTGGPLKDIEIDSVSGEIDLAASAPTIEVDSVSGDLTLDAPAQGVLPELHAETVSGDMMILDDLSSCKLTSISGDVTYQAGFPADGSYEFEIFSGDIEIAVPASTGARFEITTFSGEIESDFTSVSVEREGPGRGDKSGHSNFTIGDGRARVRIESMSGDVSISPR